MKDRADPPLDTYRLSQLGLNPPPGLTVTPIGINGSTSTPPPLVSSSSVPVPPTTRLESTPPPPPPPYHASHITTTTSSSPAASAASVLPAPISVPPVSGTVTSTAAAPTRVVSQLQHAGAGRTKMATMSRMSGRPRIISWMDAPDDVYFYSTAAIK